MKNNNLKWSNKQSGVTLIEALVSLFIFSIGALGVAALQATSLVRTDDTKQRSIAIWKAQELIDRIRSTKTIANPAGQIQTYINAIPGNNVNNIGVMANQFSCNAIPVPNPRCEDQNNVAAATCTAAQMAAFDIWSVMCDPSTGLGVNNPAVGTSGLRNLEVALQTTVAGDSQLYIEWLSGSANSDTDLQNADGSAPTVVTNLCGQNLNVDSRLDVYCVRFQ